MKRTAGRLLLLAGIALALGIASPARNTVNGTITGTVTDHSGAVVMDANITTINEASQVRQSRTTNASGIYLFSDSRHSSRTTASQYEGRKCNGWTGRLGQAPRSDLACHKTDRDMASFVYISEQRTSVYWNIDESMENRKAGMKLTAISVAYSALKSALIDWMISFRSVWRRFLSLLLAAKTRSVSAEARAELKKGLQLNPALRDIIPRGYLVQLH